MTFLSNTNCFIHINLSSQNGSIVLSLFQNIDIITMENHSWKYKKNSQVQLPRTLKDHCREEEEVRSLFFDSEDSYVKKILMNHGWKMSKNDKNSTLQWVYNIRHNTFSQLASKTKINHFPHSHLLTTKLGLCKTLKNQKNVSVDYNGSNHISFYPRSYDLRQMILRISQQNDEFIRDFKTTAILNLLKKIMIAIQIQNPQLFAELHSFTSLFPTQGRQVNWLFQLKKLYKQNKFYKERLPKSNTFIINGPIFENVLLFFSLMFTLDQEGYQSLDQEEIDVLVGYSQFDPPYRILQEHYGNNKNLVKSPTQEALGIFFGIYKEALQRFAWFRTDGLRNVWVVKANDSSRGRSIFLISSLEQLKSLNSGTRLVQKYLQDVWIFRSDDSSLLLSYPFLPKLLQKKFDIRIWVLVLSFSPLKVYIFEEGYLRISQQKYQLNQLNRNCTHLTNFTVNWKTSHLDHENSYVMLSEFIEFLEREGLKRREVLWEEIQKIVRQSLEAVDLGVSHADQRCFQLYGYDIILDSELSPWLLEVNMSPACKERGRLAQVVETMGRGLLSLVGLIQPTVHSQKWKPLVTTLKTKKRILKTKQIFPESQPSLSKCFSVRSVEDQSKISVSFPSIVKGDSIHYKYQNLSSGGSICELMIIGQGYTPKQIRRMDYKINMIFSVKIIERYYGRLMKNRIKKKEQELGVKARPLTFLKLLECLTALQLKGKLRVFKKLKKRFKKRCKHVQYTLK